MLGTDKSRSYCLEMICAAIRHRTRRTNEPKPVSVRCLSYGTNFPEPDSGTTSGASFRCGSLRFLIFPPPFQKA